MSRQKRAPKRGKKQAAAKSTPEIVSSSNECHINILLDDLVLDIFFNFELAKIVDLSLVCRKWRQLTLRQEYWRFHSIHQWGKNIVPNSYEFLSGGSIQVDLKKYMIPTFKIGNTTTVDWRKYFKIRFFWEEVKFALDRHYYLIREDLHEPIVVVGEDQGRRTILMPEGHTTGLSPTDYEEWDENSWSHMSDDEDEIEFGEYLDDEEYRKAMKLDEESDDAQAVSDKQYEEDALRKSETHRYTEDLYTESILKFFMRVPRRDKAKLDLPERFPRLLSIFSIEVFPLLLEAEFYSALIVATKAIYRCAVTDQIFGKPYEISQDIYELCLLVEDKPKLMVPLLFAACYKFKISNSNSQAQTTLLKNLMQKFLELTESEKIFAANKAFDEVLQKLVKKFDEGSGEAVIIKSFIEPPNIYTLKSENLKLKRSMTRFVDPIQKYELFGVLRNEPIPQFGGAHGYLSNEECVPVLIDFIISKFTEATDQQKIVLLTLSDITVGSLSLCLKLFPLACEATKHKNDNVAFAAYTLLFCKMSSKFTNEFPEKLTKTVFEALLRGLDRFPTNSLCIIAMFTKLLKNKSKLITDKQLEEMNTKILANMAKPEEFFHKEVIVASEKFLFEKFYKLGEIFGQRMAPCLKQYRQAIMEAGKADLMAALVINKKGDKVIMQMNSSPQRWIQYALFGEYCGVKNLEEDLISFVKEIMEFFRKKNDMDELSNETEKEFHALFADVISKIIIDAQGTIGQQYREHIENILGAFPAHFTEFGKKFFASKLKSNAIYPRTPIPETAAQLQVAVMVENEEKASKNKKGKKKQEPRLTSEQLVNYVFSQQYLDSAVPKEKEKNLTKKYQPEFNLIEWQEHGGSNFFETMRMKKEMDQLPYNIAKYKLFDLLDTILNDAQILKAFHLILAFAKVEESVDFTIFEHMYFTYEKLRDEFDESTQCFYLQSMASIMAVRLNEKNVHYHIRRVIFQYARKLGTRYFENTHKSYQPIVGLLAIAVQLDSCLPYDKFFGCKMTYDTIKLMLLKSPLGVFQAAINCAEMSLLFADHPENDPFDEQYVWRLHSLVLLGHHFGVQMLISISSDHYFVQNLNKNRFKMNMLPTKIVDYLNQVDRSKVKPQLIDRMERFLVLFKVYLSEGMFSNIRYVNLYNSMYFEIETIKNVLRSKKFITGIAELDKRAKKWENIYDLNKTDLYDTDELSSDDESEENSGDNDDDMDDDGSDDNMDLE